MKNIQTLFSAAMCGLVFAFTTVASAQDVKQGIVTVVRVQGPASYSLESGPDAKWIPLLAGKVLMAGSSIRTSPDGNVDLVLGRAAAMPKANGGSGVPDRISMSADAPVRGMTSYTPEEEQNTVRVMGGTILKVDKLTVSDTGVDTVSDTELDLQKGRIFANVKKLTPSSQYLIKIPSGIAGVRGTFFGLDASGWCAVLKHQVDLALVDAGGAVVTHTVAEGEQYDPGTGQNVPASPAFLKLMNEISVASATAYMSNILLATPECETFVSPTTGNKGHHHGGGNSGNGNGNGGGNGAGGGGNGNSGGVVVFTVN